MDNNKSKTLDISSFSTLENKKPNLLGVRHVQALLMALGMILSYFQHGNISAAIVPMTRKQDNAPYYDWDAATKSIILSSFLWGYMVMQFPAGILARMYGPKLVYSLAMLIGGAVTLCTPLAASGGNWKLLCVSRIIVGLMQGVTCPCNHTFLAKWAPSTERSLLTTFVYNGSSIGSMITLGISGSIFESAMGWPGIFYISGACSVIWGITFLIFGCDSPADSKSISNAERVYIESLTCSSAENQPKHIPWKSIFTSPPVYGLLAVQCSYLYGYYTLFTEIPTYFNGALQLNVQSNALLSALPYLVTSILSFVVSPLSDWLINEEYLSKVMARKLFCSISTWMASVCLIGMAYMSNETKNWAIALLVMNMALDSASTSGYLPNHIDLSPNFAGVLMAMMSTVANVFSIIAPLVVGVIVTDETDVLQWRTVFAICAAMSFVGNLLFLIFGKANIQSWNSEQDEHDNSKNKTKSTKL